ncbi:formylmethanofuran dehydrogenase [Hyphomicrobium sulfonivorans]|uniref:formylmethanofuran dehydrogenase n=1 Tax=Hyphomicrobium sulfonivorans TaxID=121290 RepID=UPI00156EC77A|nr:formylmethanofuran dehydrogenase [Hyphomicrobium sulfonivorans]MBI1650985.1 formylmethanofuran dehydrogenase [Hyphomicrobium sulfonivorans]NSL72631.1 formylmethanofuran dehydrogenase [Hyphomicrobium sulfonivorans]
MTAQAEGDRSGEPTGTHIYNNVTCPFCGLLCDDLQITRTGSSLKVNNGCPRATAGFQRPLPAAKPLIRGSEASLEEAVKAAAEIVRGAKLPLYGGMAGDVGNARAMLSIADRTGGVVDHVLSEGQYRNFRVVQTSGWIMTTLTEARNRADLFVIVGSDIHKLHGRFFDRIVTPDETMFESLGGKRTVIFIGEGLDTSAATGPRVKEVITLPAAKDRIPEVLAAISAIVRGHPISSGGEEVKRNSLLASFLGSSGNADEIAGIKRADIEKVAEKFKAANYGVLVWSPPALNMPEADLTVHMMTEIVRELNLTTRFAGLSLGGNEGAPSAASTCTWQTGYPLRVSFASGAPEYDANRYNIARMLTDGEGDMLMWVASIGTDIGLPQTAVPTVVLGTPGLRLAQPPTVYIPVGTPGIDHSGQMVRCDNVVSLPMQNLGRSQLPSSADVLAAIEAAL